MSIVHVLLGVFFVIFAIAAILFLYNDAIAPAFSLPRIWGN